MKTEPDVFSIDDLKKNRKTLWDGVRNYQARNFMRDQMKTGDEVLLYHSNANPPGIAGLARVSKLNCTDPTQFDKAHDAFDPKSKKDSPTWICVEVEFVKKFSTLLSLEQIKARSKELDGLLLLRKGQRLSVQPVTSEHYSLLVKMCEHGLIMRTD